MSRPIMFEHELSEFMQTKTDYGMHKYILNFIDLICGYYECWIVDTESSWENESIFLTVLPKSDKHMWE